MINFFYPPQPKRIWPNSPYILRLNDTNEWDAEIKYNGWRLLIFINNGKLNFYNRKGTIIEIHTDGFQDYFKNISNNTVFDAELLNFRTSDLKNKIVIFDVPFYNNKNLQNLTLLERRKYLNNFKIAPSLFYMPETPEVFKVQQFTENFNNLYNDIEKRNNEIEEGLVLKKKNSIYYSSIKSGKDINDWLKVKKIDKSNEVKKYENY